MTNLPPPDNDFIPPFRILRMGIAILGGYEIHHVVDSQDREFVSVFQDKEKAERLVRFLNYLTES